MVCSLDALSLLVDAANAQSSTAQKPAEVKAEKGAAMKEQGSEPTNKVPSAAAAALALQNHRAAEMEFREALQRQAYEREVHEREAILQQRAAQMAGYGGFMNYGLQFQEAEYMQQLRLEALVQQRRQETLAQLALAQEYNMQPEVQVPLNAQQVRQATMLRALELFAAGGGLAHPALEQMAALRGRDAPGNENPLLRLFEQRDRQQKLAALGAPATVPSHDIPAASAKPEPVRSAAKPSASMSAAPDNALSLAGSKVTVLPCRARGMPMDHNAKTAYFVIPEDIKHGAELVCSYNACRNAGTKFRYCVHCSLPVAKRNFFKRHKHAGKIPTNRLVDGLHKDDDDMSSSDGEDKKPAKKRAKKFDAKKLLDKLVAQKAKEVTVEVEDKPKKSISSGEMARLVENRKKTWETLLGKRPRSNNQKLMLKWVQSVLAASDQTTPVLAASDQTTPEEKETSEPKATENGTTDKKMDELISTKNSAVEEDASSGNTMDDDGDVSSVEKNDKGKPEEDGNISDGSTSSSDGSMDLRAHKKLKFA